MLTKSSKSVCQSVLLFSRDNTLWKLKAKEDIKPSLSHSTFKVVSSPRSTGSPSPLSYCPSHLQQPFIFVFLGPVITGASLFRVCVCVRVCNHSLYLIVSIPHPHSVPPAHSSHHIPYQLHVLFHNPLSAVLLCTGVWPSIGACVS